MKVKKISVLGQSNFLIKNVYSVIGIVDPGDEIDSYKSIPKTAYGKIITKAVKLRILQPDTQGVSVSESTCIHLSIKSVLPFHASPDHLEIFLPVQGSQKRFFEKQ